MQLEGPGVYRVSHHGATVKADAGLDSPAVARLAIGQSVVVLEVVTRADDRRVRGRVADPAGWMTLRETATGYRWACLVRPVSADTAGLVSQVVDRGAQLEALRARAARLRAESQVRMNSCADRVQELEDRLLVVKLVPQDPAAETGSARAPALVSALQLEADRELADRAAAAAALVQRRALGVPAGGMLVGSQQIPLDLEMSRAFVVDTAATTERSSAKPGVLAASPLEGRVVASNAWYKPSAHHVGGLPSGVFPVTWPAGLDVEDDLIDQRVPPLPLPSVYGMSDPCSWRLTAAVRS